MATTAPTALPTVPAALEGDVNPDANIFASDQADSQADPQADLNAANRVKGFLGMTGEIVPSMPADPVGTDCGGMSGLGWPDWSPSYVK